MTGKLDMARSATPGHEAVFVLTHLCWARERVCFGDTTRILGNDSAVTGHAVFLGGILEPTTYD